MSNYSQYFAIGNNTKFYKIYKNYDTCGCVQPAKSNFDTGYNTSIKTQSLRTSNIINNSLGGRTTFGNLGTPAIINYLGRVEGQPGGSLKALRNTF